MFSRLARELPGSHNRLYRLLDDLRQRGETVHDLIGGNVHHHGITFPPEVLEEIFAESLKDARIYTPDSLGQRVAREAIAQYYQGRVAADRILVTPGTSVSYWYCFRLLSDPGGEILCPTPSYPLFDYIAAMSGVKLANYRLLEAKGWAIDLEYLENRITTNTRAIVLISPHNPTGMVANPQMLLDLAAICARHRLPIISDEVFSEFLFGLDELPRPMGIEAPLVLTLNGFSKLFALPGMKIGWIAISGEEALVRAAVSALELMADTFLPVNEAAQFAVPRIFERGEGFRKSLAGWISGRRDQAVKALGGLHFEPPQGGFYLTLKIDEDEDAAALRLLENHRILVHPGHFYDMTPDHLVLTIVGDTGDFRTLRTACKS